jgi:hypothetical protein
MYICFPLGGRVAWIAHYPPDFDCFQGGEMVHSSIDGSIELRNLYVRVCKTVQCNVLEATIMGTRLDKDAKQLNCRVGGLWPAAMV